MSEDADDDDDFDESDDSEVTLDEIEDIDEDPNPLICSSNARRRLEQLREEKELERVLRGDFWD